MKTLKAVIPLTQKDKTSLLIERILRKLTEREDTETAFFKNYPSFMDSLLDEFFGHLPNVDQEKALRRVVNYMRRNKLISVYEDGLTITNRGLDRLARVDFDKIAIPTPLVWDGKWRIVMFDIPERYKSRRNAMSVKLTELGFRSWQRSVWVHPYPCRPEIEVVAMTYRIPQFVTYLETDFVDRPEDLLAKFPHLKPPKTN